MKQKYITKIRAYAAAVFAIALAALTAHADTPTVYTVTVSGGTFSSPVSIESQQVEIYDADAGTTTTENFTDVTFKPNSIFRKRGTGYMLSSLRMSSFTGEIRIEEGAFIINTNNQMGVTTAAANAPLVVVSNGASFVMATRSNTCASKKLKIYNQFQIAGGGCDSHGAICNDNDTEQTDYCFYGKWTLTGDATVGTTKATRFDCGCTIDLAGHQLTVRRVAGNAGLLCMSGVYSVVTNSANSASRIVMDGDRLQLQGEAKFYGDASSEIVFTNSAALLNYGYSSDVCGWTMRYTSRHNITPQAGTQKPGEVSGNRWHGPFVLDGSDAVVYIDSHYSKVVDGMLLTNVVSGAGSITALDSTLQLGNPANTFTGSIGMWADNDKKSELVLWHPRSMPSASAGLFVTNTSVTLLAHDGRYELPSTTVHVKEGTNMVFSGGCGGFAPSFRKAGAGRLDMSSLLTVTGRAEVVDGTLKFSRYARAGLVAGRYQMPVRTNFDLPQNTHWTSISSAAQNLSIGVLTNWVECVLECLTRKNAALGRLPAGSGDAPGVIVMFNGYIWNRTGETQRWTFAGGVEAHLHVWLDGNKVFTFTEYNKGVKNTLNVTPGAHRLRIASYTSSKTPLTEDKYITPLGPAFDKSIWSWKLPDGTGAGFRFDPQGRDSGNYMDYITLDDPGDGSLLTVSTNDTLTAVQDEPSFWTLRLGTGATLDTFGNGIMVGDLEGLGTVTNSNAYYVHPLTVTNSWKVSAADVAANGVLRVHVPLTFAEGATFSAENLKNFPRAKEPIVLCTADEPITGMPEFDSEVDDTTRKWKLEKSADGRSLLFHYTPPGFAIIYR